jgi:hypothetical protein
MRMAVLCFGARTELADDHLLRRHELQSVGPVEDLLVLLSAVIIVRDHLSLLRPVWLPMLSLRPQGTRLIGSLTRRER